jgi:hypothetical protein
MGGLGGSLLKGLLDKMGSSAGDKAFEMGEKAWEFTGSKENVRALHPVANDVMDLDLNMIKTRGEIYQKLQAPVDKMWESIKTDPALRNDMDYRKASIGQIHQNLVSKGHPLQATTQQILMQNLHPKTGAPLNIDHTYEEMGIQNKLQANRMAADKVLGPHMQNLIPHIQDLYDTGDPKDKSVADLLIRIVSNDSHDTFDKAGAPRSRTADEIRTAFIKENKTRAKLGGGAPLPLPRTEATYQKSTPAELKWRSLLVSRLAGLAVLPHMGMFGNLMSSPMMDIVKGLSTMKDQNIKDLSTAAGLLTNTMHSMMYNDFMGRTGQTAKLIGQGPASFLYKSLHMPMFNTVRMWQLSLAASVGYHSAADWAAMAAKGSKIGIEHLKEFKLDPQAIAARGGKLTEDEMQQAMFHYVNNRMFVDRPMDRSLMANANPYIRSATMFHSVIISQARFMRRELGIMYRSGDVKGIIQFAGTLGILFPAVMPMLHGLEVLGRTASPSESLKATETDYKHLTNPTGILDWAGTYMDMLSYTGAFGIWHSMIQSAWGDRLASTMLGPMFGPIATLGGDTIKAATKPFHASKAQMGTQAWKDQWKQEGRAVGRDVSELAVPIVGKWAGHKLFPTLAEERSGQIPKPRRRGRRY